MNKQTKRVSARELHRAEGIFECFEPELTELVRQLVVLESRFYPPGEIVERARSQFLLGARRGQVQLRDKSEVYALLREIVILLVHERHLDRRDLTARADGEICFRAQRALARRRQAAVQGPNASLKVQTLEPRILLSASWMELGGADACDDVCDGGLWESDSLDLEGEWSENGSDGLFDAEPEYDLHVDAGDDVQVDEGGAVTLNAAASQSLPIVFDESNVDSYGHSQDRNAEFSVQDDGETLMIVGNGWKKIDLDYTVTENTVLSFDFLSSSEGEVHGIGFDTNNSISTPFTFQVFGTQNWGVRGFEDDYSDSEGQWKHYEIRVGDYYTGDFDRLFFVNDHDTRSPSGESHFRNVSIHESGSADGDHLQYTWTQVGGLEVELGDMNSSSLSFSAPEVDQDTELTFEVSVFDGHATATDTVTVSVDNRPEPTLTVDAGPDLEADELTTVSLGGSVHVSSGLPFEENNVYTYGGNQDRDGTFSVEQDGTVLHIYGDTWKSVELDYEVTENTILSFDFLSGSEGDVHGIGFDTDDTISRNTTFQLYGTQKWGVRGFQGDYDESEGEWKHYEIRVGDYFTGDFDRLVFVNDDDARHASSESLFRNVSVRELGSDGGGDLLYSWTQVGGPEVALTDADSLAAGFEAPNLAVDTNLTFRLQVSDGTRTATDTVSVLVRAENDPSRLSDDHVDVLEDGVAVTGDVLANDVDPDSQLVIHSFTQAGHGTVVDNGDGTFTYTPEADYFGTDAFTYTVDDGLGNLATATVTVDVEGVQDEPVAWHGSTSVNEDESVVTENVITAGTDVDGDVLAVTGFTQGSRGSVVDNGDGTFTYTPEADYFGTDAFTYTITDGHGNTDTATVSVDVLPVQDAPTAWETTLMADEGETATTGDVLAGSHDPDGDTLSLLAFTQATHGAVVDNADGTFSYTSDENFHGTDTFTYSVTDGNGNTDSATVTIHVNGQQELVVDAGADMTVDEGGVVTLLATINDDYEGQFPAFDFDELNVQSYSIQDGQGVTTIEDNGATLHMVGNVWKKINLNYTITTNTILEFDFLSTRRGEVHGIGFDVDSSINSGLTFKMYGTQNFGITNYGDTYAGSQGEWKHFVIRVGDSYTGNFNRVFFANDHDVANPTADSFFSNVRLYEEGEVTAVEPNYTWTQVGGPQVTLTETDTGEVQFEAPELTEDTLLTFRVEVSDGLYTSVDTVTVLVAADNDAPVAGDDAVVTVEDAPVATHDVLANDADIDSPELTVTGFSQGSDGSVSYNGDGTFTYTPNADFHGTDSFTYTVVDDGGNTDTATVSVEVESRQDAPVAWDETLEVEQNGTVTTADLLSASTDVDGDSLGLLSFTQAANGTVVDNGDGTFTYSPDGDFTGDDSFSYLITDGNGGQDEGTIDVTVTVSPQPTLELLEQTEVLVVEALQVDAPETETAVAPLEAIREEEAVEQPVDGGSLRPVKSNRSDDDGPWEFRRSAGWGHVDKSGFPKGHGRSDHAEGILSSLWDLLHAKLGSRPGRSGLAHPWGVLGFWWKR